MNPLVTAIIATYNGEEHLREALESVFAQDYDPLEVIVIDDGSTDGSAEIAESFEGVTLIRQQNAGVAAARNVAFAASHGEFITYLDQDDIWPGNKTSVQVACLREHPDVGYVLGQQELFLEEGCDMPLWAVPVFDLGIHTGYLPGTLMVRREVIKQVGPFDPSFINGSDSDWFARATDKNIRVVILKDILLRKRIHPDNESKRIDVSRRDLFTAIANSVRRKKAEGGKA
ncbi:MAG: glycosyltransferase family 2 protein [Verrucomicrobia bacterium]|nr:glycosyltransferase family 2 protein [Verrucomicrobiota bacterium]